MGFSAAPFRKDFCPESLFFKNHFQFPRPSVSLVRPGARPSSIVRFLLAKNAAVEGSDAQKKRSFGKMKLRR